MRIGIHTSSAGALDKTAERALEHGANAYQIFSSSPRMWRSSPPDPGQVTRLRAVRERHDLRPLVIHANYLINLAALDPKIRELSIGAFRKELERALTIGAEYLVVHPGSYKGQELADGMAAMIRAVEEATAGLKPGSVTLLLENTAGSGCAIGSRFEEMALLRSHTQPVCPLPVGICIDTAHCLASGYDVASATGLKRTVEELESVIGLEHVQVIHTNDSKAPLGSKVDRHEHIGKGYIGLEGFRRIVNHPALRHKPFILETPVDEEGDERRNIETLKSLCRNRRTTTTRSS